jgi:hypothetical protein
MEYEDKAKTSYKLYKSPDLTAYDNKYCIYWYRYEKDYTPPATESFMPNNWRRLTPNELKGNGDSDGINVGLSSQYKDKDGNVIKNDEGKPLHAPKPANGKGIFTRYMQNDLEQEKYIAILFYNHNMYKSNELVFTNSEVVPDKTTLDKGDILIFEHLTNSSDDFQSYSITNYLMDASDETRERQIRCHYDGLLAKDNAFINGGIYWYVPAVATMLNVDIDDLVENKGFTLDASRSKGKEWKVVNLEESNRDYVANKYYIQNANGKYVKSTSAENPGKTLYEQTYTTYCFYKQITAVKKENADNEIYEWDKWDYANGTGIDNRDFWYKIQPFYDASATNNSIKCVFIKYQEDDEVQGEQFFTFGVKGTSGTKYTLAITKPTTQKWVTASKGLSLKAQLKDFNNSLMNFGENLKNFRVEWECYKTVDRPTDIAANAAWPNTLTV